MGCFFLSVALQRDKITIPFTYAPAKNRKKNRGGGQKVCNFVALWCKVNTTLRFSRYKTRYKKIFLSRIDYE